MGLTTSYCTYDKKDFTKRLQIIQDTHSLITTYEKIATLEKLPVALPSYNNFSEATETFFYNRRKEVVSEFATIDAKILSFYDVYKLLSNLKSEYERADISPVERMGQIQKVLSCLHVILTVYTEDLSKSCTTYKAGFIY